MLRPVDGQGESNRFMAPLIVMALSLAACVAALIMFSNGCTKQQTLDTVQAVGSAKAESSSCKQRLSDAVNQAKGT